MFAEARFYLPLLRCSVGNGEDLRNPHEIVDGLLRDEGDTGILADFHHTTGEETGLECCLRVGDLRLERDHPGRHVDARAHTRNTPFKHTPWNRIDLEAHSLARLQGEH
ncbi:MAG: hypothetical protein HYZ81_21720 [Nitrospinae bacterium]|nr:hypothetical protein [Nitrospinota bacterium]